MGERASLGVSWKDFSVTIYVNFVLCDESNYQKTGNRSLVESLFGWSSSPCATQKSYWTDCLYFRAIYAAYRMSNDLLYRCERIVLNIICNQSTVKYCLVGEISEIASVDCACAHMNREIMWRSLSRNFASAPSASSLTNQLPIIKVYQFRHNKSWSTKGNIETQWNIVLIGQQKRNPLKLMECFFDWN